MSNNQLVEYFVKQIEILSFNYRFTRCNFSMFKSCIKLLNLYKRQPIFHNGTIPTTNQVLKKIKDFVLLDDD